jgi:hypothetical protein
MAEVKRRYPRVEHSQSGEMDVKASPSSRAGRRVSVPVTIRQVSPEGIALSITAKSGLGLERGRTVTVRFPLAGHDLAIPGQIAWYGPGESSSCDAGVNLQLHLAQAAHRQVYAEWVVSLIRRAAS